MKARECLAYAAGVLGVLVALGLVGRWDYEDQVEAERAADRAAQLCLPQARGDETVVTWRPSGELTCTYRAVGGATRAAVFRGGVWTPL